MAENPYLVWALTDWHLEIEHAVSIVCVHEYTFLLKLTILT